MRSCLAGKILSSIVLFAVSGCGKSSTPAPNIKPVASPPVQNAAAPAKPAPDQSTGANDPASTKPGLKPKSKADEIVSFKIANADPKSIFVVGLESETMEVESTAVKSTSNEFEVALANPAWDSTNFVIETAVPSPQSQSVVGTGKPKAGFKLPKDFSVVKEWGYSSDGLPLRIRSEKTHSLLALVPAGPCIVGSDTGPDESKPSFKVRLDAFYMEILEVTVEDFDKFRADLRERKKPVPAAPSNADSPGQFPALGITAGSAQSYAKWAGMELPTEAEFEKAARGPTGLPNPWGGSKPLWSERRLAQTGTVAADRSPYGIFDLAGNAKEWCSDLYSPTAHKDAAATAAKEPLQNWAGPKTVRDMNRRVVKGNSEDGNIWDREGKDGGKVDREVGFRCVLKIPSDSDGK